MSIKLYELVGKDETRPFSPYCWRARFALAHKKLDFETVPTRYKDIAKIGDGGFKAVPVLEHNGKLIDESFEIAQYIGQTYPEVHGNLFAGEGAIQLSRFVHTWTIAGGLSAWIINWAILDIHAMLDEEDGAYFRKTRETRFGMNLEEMTKGRENKIGELKTILTPLRLIVKQQKFLGGNQPRYADYIVFSAFQWLRVCSGLAMLPEEEIAILDWIERMLDLYDGMARKTPEAGT